MSKDEKEDNTKQEDTYKMQNVRLTGSKIVQSIGVRASNNENPDSENDDYPPRVSKMKDLKHPAKPLFQNESDVDVTIRSNEESDDYHTYTQTFSR